MSSRRTAVLSTIPGMVLVLVLALVGESRQADGPARGACMGSRPPAAEAKRPAGQHHVARAQGPVGLGYTLYRADSSGNPVRVDPTEHFHQGDRVRLVFEPSSDGY